MRERGKRVPGVDAPSFSYGEDVHLHFPRVEDDWVNEVRIPNVRKVVRTSPEDGYGAADGLCALTVLIAKTIADGVSSCCILAHRTVGARVS